MDELFGFKGRVNRAKMWLFILFCLVFEIVAFIAASIVFDLSFFYAWVMSLPVGQNAGVDWLGGVRPEIGTFREWGGLIFLIVLVVGIMWASLALSVKRLHDRNKSGWWLLFFYGGPGVLSGLAVIPEIAEPQNALTAWIALGMGATMLVIEIWVFLELYCLRGTRGENRFGPDPLAK